MAEGCTVVTLGGTKVDVWLRTQVLQAVAEQLQRPTGRPLYVASANLDHISHFGVEGSSREQVDFDDPSVRWLVLLDGMPLVWRAGRLLRTRVEQLAGSDLLAEVLHVAAVAGARVGVLGGSAETHAALRQVLEHSRPDLVLAGFWAPAREELDDPARCRELAADVASADVHLLVVALGKPRQEVFLAEHGALTGARVAVAFGAAVDFLAGRVGRAPAAVRRAGCEWLWRLALEPRRLSHRYLVDGPPGVLALLRCSAVLADGRPAGAGSPSAGEGQVVERRIPVQRTEPSEVRRPSAGPGPAVAACAPGAAATPGAAPATTGELLTLAATRGQPREGAR